jgi:hypothetical protein
MSSDCITVITTLVEFIRPVRNSKMCKKKLTFVMSLNLFSFWERKEGWRLIHTYHTMPMPFSCRAHAVPLRVYIVLSHLIYTLRPCLIHTYHAAPVPCHDHAVLTATSHGHGTARHGRDMAWRVWIRIGRLITACGRPARVRLIPATKWSSTKVVIRSLPIR